DGLRERSDRAKSQDAENGNPVHDGLIGGVLEAEHFAGVVLAKRSLGEAEGPAPIETETELIEDRRRERVYPGGQDESIGEREAYGAKGPQILAVAVLLRPGECAEDLIVCRDLVIQPHVVLVPIVDSRRRTNRVERWERE